MPQASPPLLLGRDEFRERVFERDRHTCVIPRCGQPAVDAHHIIERRLFTAAGEEEGYFLDNGASLCGFHHRYGAETCAIQPGILRALVRTSRVVLPAGWDPTKSYDKWGAVLKRPTRRRIKYPSTPHLHISPDRGEDPSDIDLPDLTPFLNQPLVVTIKVDGSNACLSDIVAARNGDYADGAEWDLLKARFQQGLRFSLPPGLQLFGEWAYAKHSIHYTGTLALEEFFLLFAVYHQDRQVFYSWADVVGQAKALGLHTVPVVEEGTIYTDERTLEQALWRHFDRVVKQGHEGLVIRTAYPFPYGSFESYEARNSNDGRSWRVAPIGKMVREGHVKTDEHWSHAPITRNEVRQG